VSGFVAGVQADLMAAMMDKPHQSADGEMLRFVPGIKLGDCAPADEIYGALDGGGMD